ncbi:class I SAM-dependent methyltransferase [Rubripirellula amarantea]|uniref:Ubiquinone biosynthesis O-methyltransferase n=1 Tax=Rubripirellula amarantea TaxID=2527999 RepID=A0A5C5WHE5_9BACT|nr:methyltransferase [Rubripirellula amarantea]MDA8743257.1 class I SAM-dependent methyltransferase [Rubripirellula amarantea]TWT49521.1 Ubiquinone biosynthesis O-methyltransferase [Rubripirellula amarantea]
MNDSQKPASLTSSQPDQAPDPVGAMTMSPAMHQMSAYPRYLMSLVTPVLGDRVWEIGVGHGQYTAELRRQSRCVLGTDIDRDCLSSVERRFKDDDQVRTGWIDLRDRDSVQQHRSFGADSIICLNVLEHIEDDVAAMRWLLETCQPGAGLGMIVPAHSWLYGKMDEEAGHYRRYSRTRLAEVLTQAGWNVHRLRYVNVVGAAGWWFHNRVRQQAGLADESVNSQMLKADRWLPRFARVTDPLFRRIAGLSVLAHARRST